MQASPEKAPKQSTPEITKPKPWWHYGHAWMVFGGPAAVVVACMYTIYLAVVGQDPIIDQDYYKHGTEINQTIQHEKDEHDAELAEKNALEPAMRARNHAATGVNQE